MLKSFPDPRTGPILKASLAIICLVGAGSLRAHSEPTATSPCQPSIISFEGSVRESVRRELKNISADLAKQRSEIDGTATVMKAEPSPSASSAQVRALGSNLEALSRAVRALEAQISTVTKTAIPCNTSKKESIQ